MYLWSVMKPLKCLPSWGQISMMNGLLDFRPFAILIDSGLAHIGQLMSFTATSSPNRICTTGRSRFPFGSDYQVPGVLPSAISG